MKKIEPLKKGDLVAIAAPARWVTPEQLAPAIAILEAWGLRVRVPEGLFKQEGQLAGSDTHRAALMQRLLDDPEVCAIFCARGGYGTVRIIDKLNFSRFVEHPKWMVGYSDVTVLHSHIHTLTGLPTLHATMPIDFPADEPCGPDDDKYYASINTLMEWLFDKHLYYSLGDNERNRPGEATAPVVGGNLSILYSLCGSPSALDTRGKILLIEDLDEYLYHIDRMMQNLRRNGMLSNLAGLIVGGMTQMHDNTVPFGRTAEQIVAEAVAGYDYPVLFNAPFGHLGDGNWALPLGVELHFSVADSKKGCIFAN